MLVLTHVNKKQKGLFYRSQHILCFEHLCYSSTPLLPETSSSLAEFVLFVHLISSEKFPFSFKAEIPCTR